MRRSIITAVECLAGQQDGVLSRAQAAQLGADRRRIACEVSCGRWALPGRHTVAVQRGELPERARWRAALFEVGAGGALDGVTALRAAGLGGYDEVVQVSVRHGSRPGRPPEVEVHEMLPWCEREVLDAGLRRVKPEIAAVRAAAWAHTDRQAALILLMATQQRLARPEGMLDHADGLVRLRRRRVIEAVLREAASGSHTLGELDFAKLCRRRGLPEPSRQRMRTSPSGRVYLDVEWEALGVVVEIDGGQHVEPLNRVDDALRQNDVTMADRVVLRIPNLGLVLAEDRFMDQVEAVVTSRMAARAARR